MTTITRRAFAQIGAFSVLSSFEMFSCEASTSTQSTSFAWVSDKLAGMILLGAYGDALGALHEPNGLGGATGDPDLARRLPDAHRYQPPGQVSDTWWVWIDGNDIPPSTRGIPTDDTAFRLFVLEPWMLSSDATLLSEITFENWLVEQIQRPQASQAPGWHRLRHRQIEDWSRMLADARRWESTTNTTLEAARTFEHTDGNPFFRVTVPVVFGMFMYMELAALYVFCAPETVASHFSGFSRLDQGYAGVVTGLFAGLMTSAMAYRTHSEPFSAWYAKTTQHLLGSLAGTTPHTSLLEKAFAEAWTWGSQHRSLSEAEFLANVRKEIYEAPLPGNRDAQGLRVFDPLLFFKQITAVVAYAHESVEQALTLLASSPGDADTLPSMLGTLAGAWAGLNALAASYPDLHNDLQNVEDTLYTFFSYDLNASVQRRIDRIPGIRCP